MFAQHKLGVCQQCHEDYQRDFSDVLKPQNKQKMDCAFDLTKSIKNRTKD